MELYKNVFQISSLYGGRYLFQYLFAGKRLVLLDSGIADTPRSAILPFIDGLGIDPARLSMLITTHPDTDHQGGNAAIRKAAPNALVACGESDRRLVQDPANLYAERYNYLKNEHGLAVADEPSPDAGSYCRIDIGLRGGEKISLDDNWVVEILHVPGHSHGHLALYDRDQKAIFLRDAVHGRGCPGSSGTMALPVTYFYIELYLSTLVHLEKLELESLHSGHWPSMYGDEIRDFLSASRRTVEILERRFLRALEKSRAGLTLRELINEACEEFPDWPLETRDLAMFACKGHMDRLEELGKIRLLRETFPQRWQIG